LPLVPKRAIHQTQKNRCENNPEELVPVEEGKPEENWCLSRIELRKAKRKIGNSKNNP